MTNRDDNILNEEKEKIVPPSVVDSSSTVDEERDRVRKPAHSGSPDPAEWVMRAIIKD